MNSKLDSIITVMDFSGIYEKEKFYKKEHIRWIGCTDIQGKNCYCDETARNMIKERITNFSPSGLHFIDSGNYHYVTEFWTDKIDTSFVMVVFDHHSDMHTPLFGNILSCGSWILNMLNNNKNLNKVVLIGIDQQQQKMIPTEYSDRIYCITCDMVHRNNYNNDIKKIISSNPIYISIDKDVLSQNIVNTNWSQGDMKLKELKNILHQLIYNEEVIGIDICGECDNQLDMLSNLQNNDDVNKCLIDFIKSEENNII